MAPKSMGAALVLTFLFGPLGLLYASPLWAVVYCLTALALVVLTLGLAAPLLVIFWITAMIHAAIAVQKHNNRVARGEPRP